MKTKIYELILIVLIMLFFIFILSGCQSSVTICYDPNSGYLKYKRVGDIELKEFEVINYQGESISIGASKSEDLVNQKAIVLLTEIFKAGIDFGCVQIGGK